MQQQQENEFGFKSSFNLLYFVTRIWSLCVLPFLRTGFGSEAFGMDGLLAVAFMLIAGGFLNAPILMNYLGIWLAALVFHRITRIVRQRRGAPHIHSQYHGDSIFFHLPLVKNESVARGVVEPFAVFWAAMFIGIRWPQLCSFLVGAAVSLAIKQIIEMAIDEARVRRMRDAHIEQTYMARKFRQGD